MNWKQEQYKTNRWLENARFVVLMKTKVFCKMTQRKMLHRYRRFWNRFPPLCKGKSKHLDLPMESTFQGPYIVTGKQKKKEPSRTIAYFIGTNTAGARTLWGIAPLFSR